MNTATKIERANKLPEKGASHADIKQTIQTIKSAYQDPRNSFSDRWLNDCGLLIDDGVVEVAKETYLAFFTKNNSFPPVLEMEHELVSIALDLFHAGPNAVGNLTSGGSESLFLATAAAIRKARKSRPDVQQPEILLASSGYPTFEKYAPYLNYKIRRVPIDKDFRADPYELANAISHETVMMLASVSSWSHGAVDPVPELAKIAQENDVWLHVDACVGGFLAPFVRDLGRVLPDFDFSVPGVSSISADFHKYGYAAKGVSGIFFRDQSAGRDQAFVYDAWPAGLYRSPSFTGTRSGGAIAAAWAVMRYLGKEGYLARAAQILKTRDAIVAQIEADEKLHLIGRAELGTVAFGSSGTDIYRIAANLKSKGWAFNLLKEPAGIQLVLGPLADAYIERLVAEMGDAIKTATPDDEFSAPAVVYSDEILARPGSLLSE
ncbi:aspartate aminotransferase family protein [Rhizobium lentis]|uniref:pyridoxal phosphate-dependent decarboxylase family protein n=1 Tax=Rhizobium lentis TaxID=1138194 RepID=UPI001C838E2D|nr:aminotransferase class V-fold PLP-dependent enzyme [Rhizobium lentis]MBX5137690.1 aspartate aminotransferase family protein [Rhizobium lentis]